MFLDQKLALSESWSLNWYLNSTEVTLIPRVLKEIKMSDACRSWQQPRLDPWKTLSLSGLERVKLNPKGNCVSH